MKAIIILTLVLFVQSAIGQNLKSGEVNFHAIDKREVHAVSNSFSGSIDLSSGNVEFIVPVKSFKFEKELMQKHFNNQENMNSSQYPNIIFLGKVTNAENLSKEGRHIVNVKGYMTIKGKKLPFETNGLLVNKNGTTTISSSFLIDATQHGLKQKFAEKIEVTLNAIF